MIVLPSSVRTVGTYYKIATMTNEKRDFLLERGFLFQIPTAKNLLTGAGAARSWPDNRGASLSACVRYLSIRNRDSNFFLYNMILFILI